MKGFLAVLVLLAVAMGGYYFITNRPSAPANPLLLQQVQNVANQQSASTTQSAATTTAQQDAASPVPGMALYTDSDLGFSFWYPSTWQVTHNGGPDGDLHSYIQLNNQKNVEVFDILKNTTDQNTIGALATTTMGGLLVFQLGTTSEYLIPLTSSVASPPSLLVRVDSDLNSLPLIETVTATSSAIAAPADAAEQVRLIQAEKASYIGL